MKDFIVVGNGNAVIDKNIFQLIKKRKIMLGVTHKIGTKGSMLYFEVPDSYTGNIDVIDDKRCIGVSSSCWFTTYEHNNFRKLELTKSYNPACYPKYDNYDAIESKTDNIPYDYDGVIGVPITFLDRWDPEQFELIAIVHNQKGFPTTRINGKKKTYVRILIKRRR